MLPTISQTVGVDISKATLDVYLHAEAIAWQFPNTMTGVVDLLAWLGQDQIHRVIFEPTGAYHHRLERQLGATGVPMVKVNHKRVLRALAGSG